MGLGMVSCCDVHVAEMPHLWRVPVIERGLCAIGRLTHCAHHPHAGALMAAELGL